MDFSKILDYLQNLLANKQSQQASQFGQNLGLQQQSLAQRGQQFDANLALQTQAEKDATAQAASQLALQQAAQQFSQGFSEQQLAQATDQFNKQFGANLSAQQFAQQLATKQQDLAGQQQTWQQGFQDRTTPTAVSPGSGTWYQMTNFMNQLQNTGGKTGTSTPKGGVDMTQWNYLNPGKNSTYQPKIA